MTAKFAPVAPVQMLRDMLARGIFGDYHLFLAHHTVERKTEFDPLIGHLTIQRELQYRTVTIIMDNSIVELGGAVDDDMIREAVLTAQGGRAIYTDRRIRVIPVLPDVMGDGEATRELSEEAYIRWQDTQMPGESFMLVTQGNCWEDFCRLVNHFFVENADAFPKIGWVGIPRLLLKSMNTRWAAIHYIKAVAPHVKIHLLGFSDNIWDDVLCARVKGVTGIDSAVPCRYNGLLTPITTPEAIGKRTPDWLEKGVLSQMNVLNIQNCRKWVNS